MKLSCFLGYRKLCRKGKWKDQIDKANNVNAQMIKFCITTDGYHSHLLSRCSLAKPNLCREIRAKPEI